MRLLFTISCYVLYTFQIACAVAVLLRLPRCKAYPAIRRRR